MTIDCAFHGFLAADAETKVSRTALEGVDWNCAWGTDAATHLFATVRALCGVPPAVLDLSADTIEQALREAREILERAEFEEAIPVDDEADNFMTFAEACRKADSERRPAKASAVVKRRAAASTIEALTLALRARGVRALDEPDTRRRLAELTDDQAVEVGTRLRKLKAEIARPWTADEVLFLLQTRERQHDRPHH